MECKGVLLDTSFFIRFLDEESPLFSNAIKYYKHFIYSGIPMYISTISIAEYCTKGDITELPLKDLLIIAFNTDHSIRTGEFAKIVFREKGKLKLQERNIIPNDTKLFSQADVDKNISHYLSSDKESIKIYNLLQEKNCNTAYSFINLDISPSDYFGFLDL